MLADADDLHGVGAAGFAEGLPDGQHDGVAALHGAALELEDGPDGRGLAVIVRWPIPS